MTIDKTSLLLAIFKYYIQSVPLRSDPIVQLKLQGCITTSFVVRL